MNLKKELLMPHHPPVAAATKPELAVPVLASLPAAAAAKAMEFHFYSFFISEDCLISHKMSLQ
ncbi:hypothetical protein DOY81_010962 [Sarcophaga bullata]|nr:hypothetical protein DOY81_010962 [Sarcophaga bullata]